MEKEKADLENKFLVINEQADQNKVHEIEKLKELEARQEEIISKMKKKWEKELFARLQEAESQFKEV